MIRERDLMEKHSLEIEGFFLSFTPEEKVWIEKRLETLGYECGCEGIKKLIFDCLQEEDYEEEKVERISKVNRFIERHPEVVNAGVNLLKEILIKKGR